MKQVCYLALLVSVFLLTSYRTDNGKHYFIKTIVIDPGHGGHDAGCLGSSSKEKDVALAIGLKLGKFIEDNYKDIKVIYTRKTDIFIELHERAAIANNNKADLFICIHCNSGPKDVFGAETYVMGLHRTESNLNVAKRENASILMESDYKANYDGFDPNSPEASIIWTLYQNAFMDQSLALSTHIQNEFREKLKRNSRGVKQAGFLVLYKTTMPSILIETGFLTNPNEEKFLASEEGQVSIAESIFRAFKAYKGDVELGSPEKENTSNEKEKIDPRNETELGTSKQPDIIVTKDPSNPKVEKKDSIPVKKLYEKPQKGIKDSCKTTVVNKGKENEEKTDVIFKVQIGSVKELKELEGKMYKQLPGIKGEKTSGGRYTLYFGETANYREIVELQSEARKKGFKEAFAVAFNNGKRIAINDALSLLKKK